MENYDERWKPKICLQYLMTLDRKETVSLNHHVKHRVRCTHVNQCGVKTQTMITRNRVVQICDFGFQRPVVILLLIIIII